MYVFSWYTTIQDDSYMILKKIVSRARISECSDREEICMINMCVRCFIVSRYGILTI